MGRVPDVKRIVKEDFDSEYHSLIEKLAFPLNSHMEQVRNILSKNINIDNLAQDFVPLKVQTGSNGQPLNKLSFKSTLKSRIRGLVIISANVTSSNTSFLAQAPFITFSQNEEIVNILHIAGLAPETTYELLLQTIS